MLKIAVLGAGRMGREIIRLIGSCDDLELGGVWARKAGRVPGSSASAESDLQAVLSSADVAVDFSLPGATLQVLEAATGARVPLVIGVTGLSGAVLEEMQRAAVSIPLLYDRNMSLGIAVLKDLVRIAAPQLGAAFVAEVHETHHVHKKDAPSGTAIALGEVLASSLNRNFQEVFRYAPDGDARRQSPEDIVFSAARRGEVAGEHTVLFRSDAECLELTHKVSDRRVFAQGALRAARWLERQQPGFYRMNDLLRENRVNL